MGGTVVTSTHSAPGTNVFSAFLCTVPGHPTPFMYVHGSAPLNKPGTDLTLGGAPSSLRVRAFARNNEARTETISSNACLEGRLAEDDEEDQDESLGILAWHIQRLTVFSAR